MNEVRLSNPNALTRALGRELSPHAANADGWTDLHYAATFDLADAADALLAQGANPSSALKRDVEPLDEALIRTLRSLGCRFDSWAREGDTPLHLAAWSNAANAARLLLAAGAKVNANLETGGTPLNVAARFNATATAARLIEHGADIHSKDKRGWMPLHAAATTGAFETATLLVENGADLTARVEEEGFTPLHLTVIRASPEWSDTPSVTRLLLDWGADVNAVTRKFGATALDMAAALDRRNISRVLRHRGGDITLDKPRVIGFLKASLGAGQGAMWPIVQRRRRPPRDRRGRKGGG